ncbi:MAG: hypothetical protein D3903_06905 [Candidatus Electrothrix sp. GM3_4]|nr:hypothetical protein [Candidatus Electrothrix sp. GM3_4]
MNSDNRTFDFLVFAITDIQLTIRAIDTKVGLLTALIMIPLANLSKIYNSCTVFFSNPFLYSTLNVFIIILFSLAWIFSFLCLFRVLFPKNNPTEKISGHAPAGLFFLGNYFKLNIFDCFLGTKKTSCLTFEQHLEKIHEKSGDFIDELTFEQMKLVYILNTKLKLYRWGAALAIIWAALGGLIWLVQLSV